MAKKKHGAVLVAVLSNDEESDRARRAATMIKHSGFDPVRIVDVGRLHAGFMVLDNDDIVERCFGLFAPDHPNVVFCNGDINWLSPQEVDAAATMPRLLDGKDIAQPAADDVEMAPLKQKYSIIAGKQPDKRWSKTRLLKEIEALQSASGLEVTLD